MDLAGIAIELMQALEAFVRIYSAIVGGLGILAGIGFLTQRYRSRRRAARPTLER